MDILYFLEGLRTPFFDVFFSLVTCFGEATLFTLIAMFVFWCVDKREGYYLLFMCFLGNTLNSFLKIFCRIPRPWVRDPNFTIVESARAEATGYSFPSGHTQCVTTCLGGIARWTQQTVLRWACCVIVVLTSFSRLYLGVHSPADVAFSFLIAAAMVFVFYPCFTEGKGTEKGRYILFFVLILLAALEVLYMELTVFPADIDAANLASAHKNAYLSLGTSIGLLVTYAVDRRWLRFDTKAVWWAQLLKFVLGMALVVGFRVLAKAPLQLLCHNHPVADCFRYLGMILIGGVVWPLTFPFFSSLGQKKE